MAQTKHINPQPSIYRSTVIANQKRLAQKREERRTRIEDRVIGALLMADLIVIYVLAASGWSF